MERETKRRITKHRIAGEKMKTKTRVRIKLQTEVRTTVRTEAVKYLT